MLTENDLANIIPQLGIRKKIAAKINDHFTLQAAIASPPILIDENGPDEFSVLQNDISTSTFSDCSSTLSSVSAEDSFCEG